MISNDNSQPLINHLIELRRRLIHALICFTLIFIVLLYFSNHIYALIAKPLISQLPDGSNMIATDIASPFFTPIKLTALVALFVSIPYILYQIWGFVAPALYKNERRLVLPLLISSTALFYLGLLFAYFVVFPVVFYFFIHTAPADIAINTDITKYLDFVMTLFMVFGFAFEEPIAIILLCWSGITTVEHLKSKRPYIIVAAFTISMFITPPDVFSQTLLAIPMCILFEVGLFFAHFYKPKITDHLQQDKTEMD